MYPTSVSSGGGRDEYGPYVSFAQIVQQRNAHRHHHDPLDKTTKQVILYLRPFSLFDREMNRLVFSHKI